MTVMNLKLYTFYWKTCITNNWSADHKDIKIALNEIFLNYTDCSNEWPHTQGKETSKLLQKIWLNNYINNFYR